MRKGSLTRSFKGASYSKWISLLPCLSNSLTGEFEKTIDFECAISNRTPSLPTPNMDLNSLRDQVSNLTLYDVKSAVRKVQNGKLVLGVEV